MSHDRPADPYARPLGRRWSAAFVVGAAVLAPLLAGLAPLLALPLWAAPPLKLADFEVGNYPIGGDFTLTDHNGKAARLADYRGKAVLLTFGYTHCPDVCPATLALFQRVKRGLGARGARLQVLFISVDPQRDTPTRLGRYLARFDPTFLGLTGPPERLRAVAGRYMSKFEVGRPDHDVAHAAFIYLIDPHGKVRYLFALDAGHEVIQAGVETVLAGQP